MLGRLFDRLLAALGVVAALCLALMAMSVDFEVLARYLFNRPTKWVIDFTEYALLYILFLASAWALAKENHIVIDILLGVCPPRARRVLDVMSSLIGAVASGIFFWFSAVVTLRAYEASEVIWHSLIVPKWPVWIVMPFGSLLLTIQFLRRTWIYLKRFNRRAAETP